MLFGREYTEKIDAVLLGQHCIQAYAHRIKQNILNINDIVPLQF